MKRHDDITTATLLAVLTTLTLGGCATESATEEAFGDSVRHMISEQSHQPGDEAAGLEGEKSRYVLDEYRRDVAQPETVEKIININLD